MLGHVWMVAEKQRELILELEMWGSTGSRKQKTLEKLKNKQTNKQKKPQACPCSISFLLKEVCLYVYKLRNKYFCRPYLRKKEFVNLEYLTSYAISLRIASGIP